MASIQPLVQPWTYYIHSAVPAQRTVKDIARRYFEQLMNFFYCVGNTAIKAINFIAKPFQKPKASLASVDSTAPVIPAITFSLPPSAPPQETLHNQPPAIVSHKEKPPSLSALPLFLVPDFKHREGSPPTPARVAGPGGPLLPSPSPQPSPSPTPKRMDPPDAPRKSPTPPPEGYEEILQSVSPTPPLRPSPKAKPKSWGNYLSSFFS